LIANTHDSTPTHNNEVVGVQSTINEEKGSVTAHEWRESHFTVPVMSSDEDIF
jgi:hypothetical protein